MTTQCYSADYLYFERLSDGLLNFKLETGKNNDQLSAINFISSDRVQSGGIELQINDNLRQSNSTKLVDSIYWIASPIFIGLFFIIIFDLFNLFNLRKINR